MTLPQGHLFEELGIGMNIKTSRTIREEDLRHFAEISGDVNPVHLDEAYARTTMFHGRIAHGMFVASFISAAVGNQLPGHGSIYMDQTLKFLAPVHIGDTVDTLVTITALEEEGHHAILSTQCFVNDVLVLDGEARVKVPGKK